MRPLLLLVPIMVCVACQSRESLVPPPVQETPLSFDPTEEYELSPWWTNGRELLRLDEAGSYVLYGDQNRYHAPLRRGSWGQKSYAVLQFAPYDTRTSEWDRIAVTKIDGRIALVLPKLEPMFGIDYPPIVTEDALLGEWLGATGTLILGGNLRYSFSPTPVKIDAPTIIAGHRGRWRLDGDRLLLTPDPPNMGPYELRVEMQDNDRVLTSPDSEFRRPRPAQEEDQADT